MTKHAFVVGDPISHSKSPKIHGFWLNQLGIEGTYKALQLKSEDLPDLFLSMKHGDSPYIGGNLTIPHKEQAFQLADHLDDTARTIGAVNTIYLKDGEIFASNTDAYGFAANLDDGAPQWRNGHIATVVGAGGACRAILYALIEAGYDEIRLFNRTFARAEGLSQEFGPNIEAYHLDTLQNGLSDSDLFINTSSMGMNGTDVPSLDFDVMTDHAIATDIVYAPLITPFLQMAQVQNRPIIDGFGMLLHQAVPGFDIWFGKRPVVSKQLRDHILGEA